MKRFVLPASCTGEGEISLTERDFHYLCRVRRLKTGDLVPAMLPDGTPFLLEIRQRDSHSCRARIMPDRSSAVEASAQAAAEPPEIELYQAVPKGRVFEEVVRSCVEAGVTRITPLVSQFTVKAKRSTPSEDAHRRERWLRIARSAAQQCGATRLPEIGASLEPSQLPDLTMQSDTIAVFLHQEPLAELSLHEYLEADIRKVVLAVGPEGGFSEAEIRLFGLKGFRPAYLGPQVLRTEHAAFFAVAAIRVMLLERASWTTRIKQSL